MDHLYTKQILEYYNKNAVAFTFSTQELEFKETQNAFLNYLPQQATILDFGCGAGRDTKYFLNLGYRVTAIDGSEELCRKAALYTGSPVRQMLFQELDSVDCYDGIWACSSILHLSMDELKTVLSKMAKALKKEGIVYASFKYGSFEGMRNGRYFTDLTEQRANELIKGTDVFTIREMWLTSDIRPKRGEEKMAESDFAEEVISESYSTNSDDRRKTVWNVIDADYLPSDSITIESTNVITGDRYAEHFLYYQLKISIAHAEQIDIIVSFLMESRTIDYYRRRYTEGDRHDKC